MRYTRKTNFTHNYNSTSHTDRITLKELLQTSYTATHHPRARSSKRIEKDLKVISLKVRHRMFIIREQRCRKK
jgi:hypothetical protein